MAHAVEGGARCCHFGVFLPTNPPKHMSRNQRYPYLASQPAYGVVVVLVIPKKADVSCAAYLSSGQPPTHHGQGQARPARRTAVDQQLALSLSACRAFDSRLLAAGYCSLLFPFRYSVSPRSSLASRSCLRTFEQYDDVRRERHDGAPPQATPRDSTLHYAPGPRRPKQQ